MELPYKYIGTIFAAAALAAAGTMYAEQTFLTFLVGWIVLIPIATCGYLAYGLREYRKQSKNSIIVSVKPNTITEKYAELIRKEEEIRNEKEALYKELTKENKVS
jgi:hypothetical protein